jgi:hypothetical protein
VVLFEEAIGQRLWEFVPVPDCSKEEPQITEQLTGC